MVTTLGAGSIVKDNETGFIVPIRDPDSLAESLMKLYMKPELRQRISQSSVEHVSQFTWKTYGQNILSIYQQLHAAQNNE